jgi:4-alpha-glucanotransferase
LVAEDLGIITPAVDVLRRRFNLPGMRVLQFAFDGQGSNPHLPHNYRADAVAYTGTHDNNTSIGWYRALDGNAQSRVNAYTGVHADWPNEALAEGLLRVLFASVAPLAIAPIQDLLALDESARFNVPGVASGNWRWHLSPQALNAERAAALREQLQICGRSNCS